MVRFYAKISSTFGKQHMNLLRKANSSNNVIWLTCSLYQMSGGIVFAVYEKIIEVFAWFDKRKLSANR